MTAEFNELGAHKLMTVMIMGAGPGGLTLALTLHRAGVPCRVYEAAPQIGALGVGINLLPHASRLLCELGLEDALTRSSVTTQESVFYNKYGQFIYREPLGRHAGYPWPQYSIHRGVLQQVLYDAVVERLGADAVQFGRQCTGFTDHGTRVTAHFTDTATGQPRPDQDGTVLVGCDGVHSVVRKQLYPNEGEPRYSGVNMWRGVALWEPFLTGASFTRIGWLATGKLVVYPISNNADGQGRQLVNWVAELDTPKHSLRDWTRRGRLEDFIGAFAEMDFDFLDVPALLRATEDVLEYPMVDQDPLERWSFGRVTLLGDAAHPMLPRGSNGAGQAFLDAGAFAECYAGDPDPVAALARYDDLRRPPTSQVVLTNRVNPPDAILREVYERTGDQPFGNINDVLTAEELRGLSDNYKQIAGYSKEALRSHGSPSKRSVKDA
jgi:2-polyprenyl-6-methoxyphenol hydroxylase-like FAD-dependent oxidoreductase